MSINSYKNRKWRKIDLDDVVDFTYMYNQRIYGIDIEDYEIDYNQYHGIVEEEDWTPPEHYCAFYESNPGSYYDREYDYTNEYDQNESFEQYCQLSCEQIIGMNDKNQQELIEIGSLEIESVHNNDYDYENLQKLIKIFEKLPMFENLTFQINLEQFTERIFELLQLFQIIKAENQLIINVQIYKCFNIQLINHNSLAIQYPRDSDYHSTSLIQLGKILENLPFLEKLSIKYHLEYLTERIFGVLHVVGKIQNLNESIIEIQFDNFYCFEFINLNSLTIYQTADFIGDPEDLFELGEILENLLKLKNLSIQCYQTHFTKTIFYLLNIVQKMQNLNESMIQIQFNNCFNIELENLTSLKIKQNTGHVYNQYYDSQNLFKIGKVLEKLPFLEKLNIDYHSEYSKEGTLELLNIIQNMQTLNQSIIKINFENRCYINLENLSSLTLESKRCWYYDSEDLFELATMVEKLPFLEKLSLKCFSRQFPERMFELLNIISNKRTLNKSIIEIKYENQQYLMLENLTSLKIGSFYHPFRDPEFFLLKYEQMLEKLPLLENLSVKLNIKFSTESICQFLLTILKIKTLKQLIFQIDNKQECCYHQISAPVVKAIQQTTHISQFEFYYKTDLVCYYFDKHFSPQGQIKNLIVNLNSFSLDNTENLQDLESLKIMNYSDTNSFNLLRNISNLSKLTNLKTLELDFLFKNDNELKQLQQTLCKMNLESLTLNLKDQMISIQQPNLKCLNLKIEVQKKYNWKPLVNSLKTMKSLKQIKVQPLDKRQNTDIQDIEFFETLSEIPNLETLVLGINEFDSIQLNLIQKLKNLKILRLSSNYSKMKKIDITFFEMLSYLQYSQYDYFPIYYQENQKYIQQLLKQKRLVEFKLNQ